MCVWSTPRRPMIVEAAGMWLLLTIVSTAATTGHLLLPFPSALDTPSAVEEPRSSSSPVGPDSLDAPQTGGEEQLAFFNEGSKSKENATPSERDRKVPPPPPLSRPSAQEPQRTGEGNLKPIPPLSGSTSTNQPTRRSAGVNALLSGSPVRRRHGHLGTPSWLRYRLGEDPSATHFEREIAQVFREVAYRDSSSKTYPPVTQESGSPLLDSPGGSRIERTTALSQGPHYDYIADSSHVDTGRRNASVPAPSASAPSPERSGSKGKVPEEGREIPVRSDTSSRGTGDGRENSDVEDALEPGDYDHDLYDMYEGHYTDFAEGGGKSEISRRGDTFSGDAVEWQALSDRGANGSDVVRNETTVAPRRPRGDGYRPVSRLSWFDALLCTNRNLVWILVNFFLGLIFLSLCLLASYRLFSLKACTHLLPRTHFVAVHLLMFVAASFKAVYLFHLAYGNKERIPLVLVLLLTNTGFPCFSSAFLILMMMMFLTADVRIYRPKLFTVHNISIFIVMELVLCFVADVIVGCAHSKSVLVLSRLLLIVVTVAVIVFYGRKHHVAIQVSQMLQREFQGELKLLVVPAKDISQERQTGIKHILRNRLNPWCLVMKLSAVAIMILCIIHLCHTIFLISSQIPAWAWWIFHISGCVVETLLTISIFVSAALTQQYDESFSFLYSFLVPTVLFQTRGTGRSKENNGTVRHQRVSFSSGTESTQYTSCNTEATPGGPDPLSRTPKVPKRRGPPVKRSATFSYVQQQQQPPDSAFFYEPPGPPFQVHRTGSASHIPIYSPGSGSHVSVYGPNLVSRVHISCPSRNSSMLVHEDGFVRIRTQMDPHESRTHGYGSQISLRDPAQLHGSSAQHPGGLGRQESLYQSLSRRRRNSRSSDILQNNFDIPESEFHPSPSSRRSYVYHTNLPQPFSRRESDYESLSRRRRNSRDPNVQQLNNIDKEECDYHSLSRRRRTSGKHRFHHMNNLDRPEGAYHGITSRQVSQEDNNDLSHYHHVSASDADCDVVPTPRRSLRDSRLSPLNLYEEQCVNYRFPPYYGSPSVRHKVSNFPASPTSPVGSPVHLGASPVRSRREAHFPKPFIRVGSNTSLQTEDDFYADYIPRGNPVRRNHSSAAYYPTRNVAPPSPVLADAQRYGSLRLGLKKKRQPGHISTINSQLFNSYPDRYFESEGPLCNARASPIASIHKGKRPLARDPTGDTNSSQESHQRASPYRRSDSVETRSASGDNDWALELIKSSSILTDFYSLKRGEGRDKASRKRGEGSRSKEEASKERGEAADDKVSKAEEAEKVCENQESESRESEEACENRQKEGEVEKMCENRQKEAEVEKVCEDQQIESKEVERVFGDNWKTSVEVEKVCEDNRKTSVEVERVCEDSEKTEGAKKVPQDQEN